MPEEPTYETQPSHGRMPQICVEVGPPEAFFSYNPDTAVRTLALEYQWFTDYGSKIKPQYTGAAGATGLMPMERFDEAKCCTFKSYARPEHTRLHTGAASPYSVGKDPNLDKYAVPPTDVDSTQLGPYQTGTGCIHQFIPLDNSYVLAKKNGSFGYGNLQNNAVYSEVIPPSESQSIRIAQTNTDKNVFGKITSSYALPEYPQCYIEIDKKDAPLGQTGCSVEMEFWNPTAQSLDGVVSYPYEKPFFAIVLGDNGPDPLHLYFVHGEPPTCYYPSRNLVATAEQDKIVDLQTNKHITLDIRMVPVLDTKSNSGNLTSGCSGAYYSIRSNLFNEPWAAAFQKEVTETRLDGERRTYREVVPISVGAGNLSITHYGMGVFTFGFGPIRYATESVSEIQGSTGKKAYDDSTGYYQLALAQALTDFKTKAITINRYRNSIIISSVPEVTTDPYSNDILVNTTVSCRSTCNLYTPYLFNTKALLPSVPTSKKLDDVEELTGIRSISITPNIENLFKIRTRGIIELTNVNGEWDSFTGVKGIRIKYKYRDDADDAADWTTVFTGYMLAPNFERRSYGQKFVQFELQDRLWPLESLMIINSPFFDGTNWLDAVKLLANYGGFSEDEIEVDENLDTNYNIPYAPNYIQQPQFRYPFGTSVMSAIDELHKLVRVFLYVDGDGTLHLKKPKTSMDVASNLITTFYADPARAIAAADSTDYVLGPYKYTIDTGSIKNTIVVGGVNFGALINSNTIDFSKNFGMLAKLVDRDSIIDPDAFNYLGFQSVFSFYKVWLTTKRDASAKCRELYDRSRYPIQTVSWSCPFYNNKSLYDPVQFDDENGCIGDTLLEDGTSIKQTFWLTGVSFNYSSDKMRISSTYQATRVRGVMY